jgi:beta-xylosidase
LTAVPAPAGPRAGLAVVALVALVAGLAGTGCARPASRPGTATASVPPGRFVNPVYRGDSADPQALRAGDRWYLVHTNTGGQNVPILTSPDLVHWTPAGDALPVLPAWANPGRTWAPEVIALAPDRYVLYYTAADRRSGRQCVGRAVAAVPGGPYTDRFDAPLVCQAGAGGSIDASPFLDAPGQAYLTWKNDGNAVGVDSWLWAQRLAPDGLSLLDAPVRLLDQTEPWEGRLVEAPFLWRQAGRLYLFYSANAYDTDRYAVGYATCAAPLGPCTKGPDNPVLRGNRYASGPGHAAMVRVGARTWLLYHAWRPGLEGSVDPGRQLWLDEVTWEDGAPHVHGPTPGPQPVP